MNEDVGRKSEAPSAETPQIAITPADYAPLIRPTPHWTATDE
jgi:hypothetical protein